MFVVDTDVFTNCRFQLQGAAMGTALDLTFAQSPEPAFDLIEPGCRGRGEMNVKARMAREPRAHRRCLMGTVVVHDQMNIKCGRSTGFDGAQELQKLFAAMATMRFADYLACSNVECGEE